MGTPILLGSVAMARTVQCQQLGMNFVLDTVILWSDWTITQRLAIINAFVQKLNNQLDLCFGGIHSSCCIIENRG